MPDDMPLMAERQRDALLRQVSLVNGGIVYIYDVGGLRRIDRAKLMIDVVDLLGYPLSHPQVQGAGALRRLVHPDDWPKVTEHHRTLLRLTDGALSTMACRMLHIDGYWRWIEAREQAFSRTRSG